MRLRGKVFLHTESTVFGDIKGLREKKKIVFLEPVG